MISENDPDHEEWICAHRVGFLQEEDKALLFCSGICAADYLSTRGIEE